MGASEYGVWVVGEPLAKVTGRDCKELPGAEPALKPPHTREAWAARLLRTAFLYSPAVGQCAVGSTSLTARLPVPPSSRTFHLLTHCFQN